MPTYPSLTVSSSANAVIAENSGTAVDLFNGANAVYGDGSNAFDAFRITITNARDGDRLVVAGQQIVAFDPTGNSFTGTINGNSDNYWPNDLNYTVTTTGGNTTVTFVMQNSFFYSKSNFESLINNIDYKFVGDVSSDVTHSISVTRISDNSSQDDNGNVNGVTATVKVTDVGAPTNTTPSITGDKIVDATEGATTAIQYSDLAVTDDSPLQDIKFEIVGAGPAYGALNGVVGGKFSYLDLIQGNITYSHNGTQNLSDTFQVKVKDGTNTSTTETIQINVANVNDVPTVTPIADQTATENVAFSLNAGAAFADDDGDTLTFSISGKPDWATFTNGVLSGTPGLADSGSYTVTVTASDGTASTSDEFIINVGNGGPTGGTGGGTPTPPTEPTEPGNPGNALDNSSVEENSDAGTVVGTLAAGSTYAIAATNDAPFEIVDGKLVVAEGAELDFETDAQYDVLIDVTTGGVTTTETFTVDLLDVEESPVGTKGNDKLVGDALGNVLNGKRGNDKLTGGDGPDIFVFGNHYGKDKITDFDLTEDMIKIKGNTGIESFEELQEFMKESGNGEHVVIDLGDGDKLIIKNVDLADLTADHFLF